MKIYIKNMVCQGTRKFVIQEVKKLGLRLKSFEPGVIEFCRDLTQTEIDALICSLRKYGLEASAVKSKHVRVPELTSQKEGSVLRLEEILSDKNGNKHEQPVFSRI
jgi:hypothetical protein